MKRLFVPLAFVFAMAAGCRESEADLARKPGLVDSLVTTSMKSFPTTDTAAYRLRLTEIMNDVATADLAVLKDKNITVGLDTRLSGQKTKHSREIEGVYYNHTDSGFVSLWDNGALSSKDEWIPAKDATRYGARTLNDLIDDIRSDKFENEDIALAGKYTRVTSTGKITTTTRYIDGRKQNDFGKNALRDNPALAKPPVFNKKP